MSLPKYDPFWAKVAELGALVFMHPGGAQNIIKEGTLGGRGDLGNIIGNPLETTYFLSRLIFDGVLVLNASFLNTAEKEAILSGNAARLLGITTAN